MILLMALFVPWAAKAQNTTTVYENGTAVNEYVPFYGYWADAVQQNQMIFPASELTAMNGQEITQMVFYVDHVSGSNNIGNWIVSLGETTATTLSALDLTTTLTEVYPSGPMNFNSDETLMTVTFESNYIYHGGNLLVEFNHPVSASYKHYYFTGAEVTGAAYTYGSQRNFLPKVTFSYQAPAATPKPSGLAVSGVTDNSATLNWVENGSATSWQICVNDNEANLITTSTKPYTLTGLTAQTAYTVKVRSVGSPNSDWTNNVSFNTTAVAVAVGDSWSDDFEGASCTWDLINGDLEDAWVWGTATNNGGTHALYISDDGGTSCNYSHNYVKVFAAKLLSFTDGKFTFSYDWKCYGESNYDFLRVALVPASQTLTAGSDYSTISTTSLPSGWIALDGGGKLNQVQEWQNKEVAVNVTAGNYYLVLAWRSDSSTQNQPPAAVDNVSITKMACGYDVTELAVTEGSITTTSAAITWAAGEPGQWQVAYKKAADAEWTELNPVSTNSYTFNSLDPATNYQVKVRAYCGGEDYGAWCTPVTFATECAVIPAVGYAENFDSYTAGSGNLPICWSRINTGTSYTTYPYVSGNNAYSTSNCLYFYVYGSESTTTISDQYAILPQMEGLSGQQITLFAKGYNANSTFKIGVMADPADVSTFSEIATQALTTSYQEFIYQITGRGEYIAIMMPKPTGTSSATYGVYIDNISIAEPPACPKPMSLAVVNNSITAHGATLAWNSEADAFVVAYKTAAEEEFTETNVSDTTITLTGLIPETAYTVKVRANCGSGVYSEWSTATSFTTGIACPAPTGLAATLTPGNGSIATLSWTSEATQWILQYGTDNTFAEGTYTQVIVEENPTEITGLTAETTYYARVKANCGAEDGESQWSSVISFTPTDAYMLTVNDGTSTNGYVPVYGTWVDGTVCSQFIIPADDLAVMTYGTINQMTFYAQTDKTWAGAEFEVYMAEVDYTTLSELVDWTAMTKVMNAAHLEISNNTMVVSLDNPYQYFGGNLMIGVLETTSGTWGSSYFYGISATGASIGGQTSSPSQQNFLPKTTFDYIPGEEPDCLKPTGLAVNYEGGTTATVTWNGEATSYNIEVNGTVTEGVTSPYTLEGLELATTYAVMMQADCGSGMLSDWTNAVSFTTDLCMPENQCELTFTLTDSYGDSWNGNAIVVTDVLTGEVMATLANQNLDGTTGEETQTVTLAVCDGREIQFSWVSGNYISEVSYTVTDINGEVIVEGSGAGFETFTYTVSCAITTCRRPTDLAVTEVGPHSAVLSWTENGEATEWIVAYTTDGTNYTEFDATTNNPFTLTGLDPETQYGVKVRPICSDFDDKWSEMFVFATDVACPAPALTVTPYPFTADVAIEGWAETYDLEWAEFVPYTPSENALWMQYDDGTFATGIGNSSAGTWTWGVMYPDSLLNGNTYLNKIAVYETSYYTMDSYTVNIYTGGDDAPGTLVGTETVTPIANGLHEITLNEPVTIDPTQNLWITLTVEGTYVICSCQTTEPNNQWVLNGSTWANIGDLSSSLADYGWMIRGFIDNVAPTYDWNTESGVTSPYTITGLEAETDYIVRVKALCGGEDGESLWAYANFTTPSACDAPVDLTAEDITYNAATLNWVGYQDSYNVQYREATKYVTVWEDDFENGLDNWTIVYGENATAPSGGYWYTINPMSGLSFEAQSGEYCASSWSWNNSAYQADNWLITPQIDLQGILRYYVRTNAGYPDSYEVLLSTTDADTTSFTVTLKAYAAAPNNGEWNEVVIDLSAYNGQTGYIAIHHVDYDMNYLCIDDFGIYNVVEATAWIPATTTEPTLAITGLTHDTQYEWQVQGINPSCEGGLTEWSEIATFTAGPIPTQTIALEAGWNYVSFNKEITLNEVKAALVEAVPGTEIIIKSKSQTHTYNPARNRWTGSLTWNLANMYLIKVSANCEIALQGFPVDPADHPIDIPGGGQYTYIAFPLEQSMSLTNAFAGFAVNGDVLKAKSGTANYTRNRWMGSQVTSLEPNVGYMYKSSASAGNRTLVFPTPTRQAEAPATIEMPKTTTVKGNATLVKKPHTTDFIPTRTNN